MADASPLKRAANPQPSPERESVLKAAALREPVPFVWRIVLGHQRQHCLAKALEQLRSLKIPEGLLGYQALEDEQHWQILYAAMFERLEDGRAGKRLAKDVDELRSLLTEEERDALLTELQDFEDEINPPLPSVDEVTAQAIRRDIKKKDLAGLIAYGSCILASYLLSTADPPASSGPGSSPTSTSAAEEP